MRARAAIYAQATNWGLAPLPAAELAPMRPAPRPPLPR
jgi:hypothetical protein